MKKIIAKEKYRVQPLGTMSAKVGSISKGAIKKTELQRSIGISIILEGFDICVTGKVFSYNIRIYKDGKNFFDEKIESQFFTKEVHDKLSRLHKGDLVYISEIKGYLFDSELTNAANDIYLDVVE